MKKVVVALGVLGLVAGLTFAIQADSAFKVTGGGQTDVGTTGPGDTIAFNAQNTGTGNEAKGQVQFIDREDGQIVEMFHGDVECLEALSGGEQGAAILAGEFNKKGSGPFEIYVEDNGEGAAADDDIIFIDQIDDPNCDDETNDDTDEAALGRGNIQVHE